MAAVPPAPEQEFLDWLGSVHRQAAIALHDGDAAPKIATWSGREPVSLFGAFWFEASGPAQARAAFERLAARFSDCTDYAYDLLAHGVSGDLAYTVGHEHASMQVDGAAVEHHLRVTEVYRREDGSWKVVHRHADPAGPRETAVPPSDDS